MTIRVLLDDDDRLVRTGFRMILRDEPDIEVVAEAADGTEAVTIAADVKPDVVLMDIRMPNLNGIEATRRIVASPDAPRVLVLAKPPYSPTNAALSSQAATDPRHHTAGPTKARQLPSRSPPRRLPCYARSSDQIADAANLHIAAGIAPRDRRAITVCNER